MISDSDSDCESPVLEVCQSPAKPKTPRSQRQLGRECRLSIELKSRKSVSDGLTSALESAARLGHRTVVEELLDQGADPNKTRTGTPPLHRASSNGRADIVRILLSYGADVNVLSEAGHTALYHAVDACSNVVCRQLIRAGANPNLSVADSFPLHLAIAGESTEIIRLLVENGAEVNLIDTKLGSPMHYAAFHSQNSRVARFLLQNGADPNLHNEDGDSPKDIAQGPMDEFFDKVKNVYEPRMYASILLKRIERGGEEAAMPRWWRHNVGDIADLNYDVMSLIIKKIK